MAVVIITGHLTRLEAFRLILPASPIPRPWVEIYPHLFPGATALSADELAALPRPSATHVKRSSRKIVVPPNPANRANPANPYPALVLRHEGNVSAATLKTLNRLCPAQGWTMENLRRQETAVLPSFDRQVANLELAAHICGFMLANAGDLLGVQRTAPLPPQVTLSLLLYGDGYSPRGRPNVTTKLALLDKSRTLFPFVDGSGGLPQSTGFLTWRELPKAEYSNWIPNRAKELNRLHEYTFPVTVSQAIVDVSIRWDFLTADHHHLWSECSKRPCVVCPWKHGDDVEGLFSARGVAFGVFGAGKFAGVKGVERVEVIQPYLHNHKGAISRMCGVVGRALDTETKHKFLCMVGSIARRYRPGDLTSDSKQSKTMVRNRLACGVSLTGREGRTLLARLLTSGLLPQPFHGLCLAYCHVVYLTYGRMLGISTATWASIGRVYTYLVHLIMHFTEGGSTATMYFHGTTHVWDQPTRVPITALDEAGESQIRVTTRYAGITSTQSDPSIRDCLGHEVYKKYIANRQKRGGVQLWVPKRRRVWLEECCVSPDAVWRRVLDQLGAADDGCVVLMNAATKALRIEFPGGVEEEDVFCVCGHCGDAKGTIMREWVAYDGAVLSEWPLLGLVPGKQFVSKRKRKDKQEFLGFLELLLCLILTLQETLRIRMMVGITRLRANVGNQCGSVGLLAVH